MILTCPQCQTRFELPAMTLGEEGHTVRCGECQETWHETPDPEDLAAESLAPEEEQEEGQKESESAPEGEESESPETEAAAGEESEISEEKSAKEESPAEEEIEIAFEGADGEEQPDFKKTLESIEDIPDAVKPIAEEQPPLAAGKKETAPESGEGDENSTKTIKSYALAAAIFALIFAGLVLGRGGIVQSYPAMNAFYNLLGFAPDIPGAGVVFDRLSAQFTEDEHGENLVKIHGFLINLKSNEVSVPAIEITLRDGQENVLKQWLEPPPAPSVPGRGDLEFNAEYLSHPMAKDVKLRFVLGVSLKSEKEPAERVQEDEPHHEDAPAPAAHH